MRRAKKTSEARAAANKRNAQRSTGPRTKKVKQTSSKNAVKHGAYATQVYPIPDMGEDDDELAEYIQSLIESLGPSDKLEYEQAHRIVVYYLRSRRIFTAESTKLQSANTPAARFQGLENGSQIDARAASALERALVTYAKLQQRVLPPGELTVAEYAGPRNEPNPTRCV